MNLLEFFLRRKGDCGLRRNRSLVCSPESNTGKLFKEEMNASTWSFFVKGSLFVASWRRLYDGFGLTCCCEYSGFCFARCCWTRCWGGCEICSCS